MEVHARQATDKFEGLWSPCGNWLAMQQTDENLAFHYRWHQPPGSTEPSYYFTRTSSLVVANMTTMRAHRLCSDLQGRFLGLEWLPGSSWLVWAKSHNLDDSVSCQSIFCLDVATGERRHRLDKLYRVKGFDRPPHFATRARLMACAEEHKVQLLKLPSLEPTVSFGSSLPEGTYVAALSFDPAAIYIAICWGHNAGCLSGIPPKFWEGKQQPPSTEFGCRFRLDIFNISTMAHCHSSFLSSRPCSLWSPVESSLLVATESICIVNPAARTCVNVSIRPLHCSEVRGAWSANGSTAILRGWHTSSKDDADDRAAWFVILSNGTIISKIKVEAHGPVLIAGDCAVKFSPKLLDVLPTFEVYYAGLYKDIQNIVGAHACICDPKKLHLSDSGHWVVAPPLHHDGISPVMLVQLDIDFAARLATSHFVPCSPVPISSRPVWHPCPEAYHVYALIGENYDVWLIDGQQHRLLQHWDGSKLLRTVPFIDTSDCTTLPTWQRMSWSNDGTKLLLVSSAFVTAIDFHFLLSAGRAWPLVDWHGLYDWFQSVWQWFLAEERQEKIYCRDTSDTDLSAVLLPYT